MEFWEHKQKNIQTETEQQNEMKKWVRLWLTISFISSLDDRNIRRAYIHTYAIFGHVTYTPGMQIWECHYPSPSPCPYPVGLSNKECCATDEPLGCVDKGPRGPKDPQTGLSNATGSRQRHFPSSLRLCRIIYDSKFISFLLRQTIAKALIKFISCI